MQDLLKRLHSFRDRRDWGRFHTAKDLAISVSVEAGELLELFQWRPVDAPVDRSFFDAVGGEIADVFIYLFLLADTVGIDLIECANSKVDDNEKRFPAAQSFGAAKPTDRA